MKMTITVGVPASGKTTWAERQDAVNINRDDIRQRLFGPFKWGEYKFTNANENDVTVEQKQMLVNAAKAGRDVIISDTNLKKDFRDQWIRVGVSLGYEVEVKLFHISPAEALRRDSDREMSVGPEVMAKMFTTYYKECKHLILDWYKTELQRIWFTGDVGNKSSYIIVDVDGTVADMKSCGRSPFDWHRVGEDLPRLNVIKTVQLWADSRQDLNVIFLSGRDGICFDSTKSWLNRYYAPNLGRHPRHFDLKMRKAGDNRPDWIVKLEILHSIAERRGKPPVLCFDDRDQVVEAFHHVGLEVFQVAPGNF